MRYIGLTTGLSGLALLVMVGCNTATTGNNTTSAVPAFLPDTIGLDISELPDEDSAASGKVRQVEGELTVRYDRTVRAASHVAHAFQRLSANALRLGAAIREDITDPNITQLSGEFEVNGTAVAYRADFAPFDFDGDGIAEGTGVSNLEPVAVRIWTDTGTGFERFFCALITVRPSSRRTGVGELFVRPGAADVDAAQDLQLHVLWDHSDAAHTFNDAFLTGEIRENVAVLIANARVDIREAEDGTVEKTVRAISLFTNNPWGFETFSSAVHHIRGTQSFLISALSTGGELQVDFGNTCVSRGNRAKTDDAQCAAFDTQDMSFLPTPAGTEADFPLDFSQTPTFGE